MSAFVTLSLLIRNMHVFFLCPNAHPRGFRHCRGCHGSGVLRTTCESDLTAGHTVEHAHSQCFIHGHSNNTLFIGLWSSYGNHHLLRFLLNLDAALALTVLLFLLQCSHLLACCSCEDNTIIFRHGFFLWSSVLQISSQFQVLTIWQLRMSMHVFTLYKLVKFHFINHVLTFYPGIWGQQKMFPSKAFTTSL